MRHKIIALLTAAAFLAVTSCATIPEERKGTAEGAGIGGAAGAVLGALAGRDVKSAVVGGLLGALVGGAIGYYYDEQKKTRSETSSQYSYRSSQGIVLRLEEASVEPQTVSPEGTVQLKMTYAVLTPAEGTEVSVIEKREIRHAGALVGNPEVTVTRKGGTYTSGIPLTLPADAKKGLYVVTNSIQTGTTSHKLESAFTVR